MANKYDILIRCYRRSREGFLLSENGSVVYSNDAFNRMLGRDAMTKRLEDIFDRKMIRRMVADLNIKESVDLECIEILGRCADLHAFRYGAALVIIVSDLDAVAQSLRRNEEVFLVLKNIQGKLVDAITVATNAAELTRKALPDDLPRDARKWISVMSNSIERIDASAQYIIEILESMSDNADKGCIPGNVGQCVHRAADAVMKNFDNKRVTLEVELASEKMAFTYNRRSVTNIVLRMLNQALADACPKDTVTLCAECFEDRLEISVRDESGRVDEAHVRFLESPTVQGMAEILDEYGDDLYLVRRIAAHYDGQLQIENLEKGKCVKVILPKTQVAAHVQDSGDRM